MGRSFSITKMKSKMIDIQSAKNLLAERNQNKIPLETLAPAAVLIPYFVHNGREHLVLTKRSDTVATHKGQIAFPGGKPLEGETHLETALRETHEEVGITPSDVDVIGPLDDIVTVTSFRVRPYFGVIPYPYDFKICTQEIAELLLVPLDALVDEKNISKNLISNGDNQFSVYYFDWGAHCIWGATARILAQFLNLFYGKDL